MSMTLFCSPKGSADLLDIKKNYYETQDVEYTEFVQVRKENEDLEEQLDICFVSGLFHLLFFVFFES
jgi:hypothetical protein